MAVGLIVPLLGLVATYLVLTVWNGPLITPGLVSTVGPGPLIAEEAEIGPAYAKPIEVKRPATTKNGSTKKASRVLWGRLTVAYLCMLAGMLSVAVYRKLKADGHVDVSVFSTDMLLALCVSPIVFRVMLGAVRGGNGMRLHGLALCAFENGFCWQGIIGEVIK